MEPGLQIDAIEERYFIHGRMEILALLNELIYRGEPVEVRGANGECMAARLLEAREHVLVFAAAEEALLNQHLAEADCSFFACPDGIRVLFSTGPATPVSWGGSAAFSVSLPARLARVQRQESVRIVVPSQQAPDVALYADNGLLIGQWPLRDLSAGGIGVGLPSQAELELAASAARAQVKIAGYGDIDCPVSVRHATGLSQPEGECGFRIGLSFVRLPEAMRIAILRYIVDVEQARRMEPSSSQTEE